MDRIPVSCPTMPDMTEVVALVKESLYSEGVQPGDLEVRFEDALRRFVGCEHAVAVSSSTFGLMLALASMDFPSGREVIVPSFAFGSTIQAIYWNGLTPVFVDCLPRTLTMDPEEAVKAISLETAAIVPVSVFGSPPEIAAFEDISRRHGIPVVFDSSQGLGSLFEGKRVGGFGRCEVFSFNSEAVVSAAEGGVVVTNDSFLAYHLRTMRQWGLGQDGQDAVLLGVSSRMGHFNLTVGMLNLQRVDFLVGERLRLIDTYKERLNGLTGCGFQQLGPHRRSNGTYFTIFIGPQARRNRDQVLEGLQEIGIQSRKMFFPPAHAHQAFRTRPSRIVGDLSNTWAASLSSLALPLYSHMTDETLHRVCDAVRFLLGAKT